MEIKGLEQFNKDVLIKYIEKHTFRDAGLIISELRLIEWDIETGKALDIMNKCVEALGRKPPREERLALIREYDAAQRKWSRANRYLDDEQCLV